MYVVSTGGRTTGLTCSFVEAQEDACVPTLGPGGPATTDASHAFYDEMISIIMHAASRSVSQLTEVAQ